MNGSEFIIIICASSAPLPHPTGHVLDIFYASGLLFLVSACLGQE